MIRKDDWQDAKKAEIPRGARTYWRKFCHNAIKTLIYTGVSYRPCETSQLFYSPTMD